MKLTYELPDSVLSLFKMKEGERIYYSVPYDIDDDGKWINDSYVVVTTKRIFVISAGKIKNELEIASLDAIKTWTR